jgi:hypothetical protein
MQGGGSREFSGTLSTAPEYPDLAEDLEPGGVRSPAQCTRSDYLTRLYLGVQEPPSLISDGLN